jgi:tripartite-type tricarboxylate transporter receptor subunit TctC
MWRKFPVLVLAVFLVGVMSIQSALGKEYPTRPIEIFVPYTAGSSFDIISRLVADAAPKYLGQPIIVVNKPGAGGSIAAAEIISSKPDGYKLVTLTNFFFAMTTKTQKIPFDPSYLTPMVNFTQAKLGVSVRGDSTWKTFNDLVDYARRNPGKLRWAHSGRGTVTHIPLLLIFRKVGVETIDIPYKGPPEIVSALLGGHIDTAYVTYSAVKEHVRAGKIRILVFTSDRRFSDPPDIPTVVELGFPEVANLATFIGLYAHKDTPEEVKKILLDAFKKTCEDPEWRKGIEKLGDEIKFAGPEFMKEVIRESEDLSVPILKELGLYVGK